MAGIKALVARLLPKRSPDRPPVAQRSVHQGPYLGASVLRRLRSRHPVDLPYEGFGRRTPTLAILGLLAVLFVIVPFLVSPLAAANESIRRTAIAIAAAFGTLFLVLAVAGARGKFGWQR